MNADGSQQRMVLPGTAAQASPAWSPDGRRIAFAEQVPPGHLQIFVVNADGTGKTRLTRGSIQADDDRPAWSPDGSHLLFERSGRIHVMRADGSNLRRIGPPRASGAVWSPDGRRIAMVVGDSIHTMPASGGDSVRLTKTPGKHQSLRWSPDGRKIMFGREILCDSDSCQTDLFVVGADGSGEAKIADAPKTGVGAEGFWSPDGATIAVHRDLATYLINGDGTGQRLLSPFYVADAGGLSWSPDGRAIALEAAIDYSPSSGCPQDRCNFEIFLVRADRPGSEPVRLTDDPLSDGDPQWSPQ